MSNGRRYHRDRCAKCLDCERKLDSHTLHLGGDDKEIYCAGCYGRRFGQAGYRGVQSTTWADEQSNANLRDDSGESSEFLGKEFALLTTAGIRI